MFSSLKAFYNYFSTNFILKANECVVRLGITLVSKKYDFREGGGSGHYLNTKLSLLSQG